MQKLSEINHKAKAKIVKILSHLEEHRKKDCWMGDRCMDCALVKRLSALGFIPEEILEIEHVNILGSPMLIRVKGASYAICDTVASHIIVEELKDGKEKKE